MCVPGSLSGSERGAPPAGGTAPLAPLRWPPLSGRGSASRCMLFLPREGALACYILLAFCTLIALLSESRVWKPRQGKQRCLRCGQTTPLQLVTDPAQVSGSFSRPRLALQDARAHRARGKRAITPSCKICSSLLHTDAPCIAQPDHRNGGTMMAARPMHCSS